MIRRGKRLRRTLGLVPDEVRELADTLATNRIPGPWYGHIVLLGGDESGAAAIVVSTEAFQVPDPYAAFAGVIEVDEVVDAWFRIEKYFGPTPWRVTWSSDREDESWALGYESFAEAVTAGIAQLEAKAVPT